MITALIKLIVMVIITATVTRYFTLWDGVLWEETAEDLVWQREDGRELEV